MTLLNTARQRRMIALSALTGERTSRPVFLISPRRKPGRLGLPTVDKAEVSRILSVCQNAAIARGMARNVRLSRAA